MLLVTNTWNIVMGVFDVTQSVVNDSAGVILSDTSIDIATVITDIETKLDAMSVGGLLGLWFQSFCRAYHESPLYLHYACGVRSHD